jgi:hypothetical protein
MMTQMDIVLLMIPQMHMVLHVMTLVHMVLLMMPQMHIVLLVMTLSVEQYAYIVKPYALVSS